MLHIPCYVSVYFLLFCVVFQLVTQFNKNNIEIVCRIKIKSISLHHKTKQYENDNFQIRKKR